MMRLFIELKNMSLQASGTPPFSIAARSTSSSGFKFAPVRHDLPVDAKARDAAVREDIQAQMRPGLVARDREKILRARLKRRLRKDRDPGKVVDRARIERKVVR